MKEIDPGHLYILHTLDGGSGELLRFVKRVGEGFPGNTGNPIPGTTVQEVLRALIARMKYVANQAVILRDDDSYAEDLEAIDYLRDALWVLEERAARRHGRTLPKRPPKEPELLEYCLGCGHIGCPGKCGR